MPLELLEVWRSVEGFKGLYEVSSEGRVRSLRSRIILKQDLVGGGYHRVRLTVDNQVYRLRWATSSENKKFAVEKGIAYKGEMNGRSKLTLSCVDFIKHWIYLGYNNKELARAFNVCIASISHIRLKRTWQ